MSSENDDRQKPVETRRLEFASAFKSVFLVAIIPILGLIVYWTLVFDCHSTTGSVPRSLFPIIFDITLERFCAPPIKYYGANLTAWIGWTSIASLMIGFCVPAAARIAKTCHRSDRIFLQKVFPPFAVLSISAVAVFYALQSYTLATVGYYMVVHWLGWKAIVFVWMGTASGILMASLLLYAAAREVLLTTTKFVGIAIDRKDQPKLYETVKSVADLVDCAQPDNIVLNVNVGFQILTEKVSLSGRNTPLEGSTVFLPVTLLRAISINELRAVIGHELAHLKANDTAFGARFASSYNALRTTIDLLDSENPNKPNLLGLPARTILKSGLSAFGLDNPDVFHDKEFAADQIGAEVASRRDMANALIKIALFEKAWSIEQQEISKQRLFDGVTTNISKNFFEKTCRSFDPTRLHLILEEIFKQEKHNPTISHPPTSQRLKALSMHLEDAGMGFSENFHLPPRAPASVIVTRLEAYEIHLSETLVSGDTTRN